MGRKLLIVLGNGFTMDFLKYINADSRIDVRNLFRNGSSVRWPADGEPGFLSFKHCPNLWNLSARPQMSEEEAMSLIEDIITCINVHAVSPRKGVIGADASPNDIYLYAYKELVAYLRHLFVAYDRAVPLALPQIQSWPWCELLDQANADVTIDEIWIVIYNYDIWLERVLLLKGINFSMHAVENPATPPKIRLLKPHGSISFVHKTVRDRAAFQIVYDRDLPDCQAADFGVSYSDLDQNYLVNAMIPPAGDSGRLNQSWAIEIRNKIKAITESMTKDDEVIVCGISYWHVDRHELDELFVSLPQEVNIKIVNPSPNRSMNTVIASLFSNFISYNNASELRGAGF